MATKNRLGRPAALAGFVLCVLFALAYAATNSGTPEPPVPLGTATPAAIGTPTPTTSGTPTRTRRPTRTATPTRTPTPPVFVWWYIPHVARQGSATPYPTPTREVIPPGSTARPSSTYAPTPTPATWTPYPDPATDTPRPTATQFRPSATPVPIAAHMDAISGTLRTMSVSVYVPMAGGINGGACVGKSHELCFVQTGHAACGPSYPRGTVFLLPDTMPLFGLPSRVVCRDRGSAVHDGALDLALVSADSGTDLKTARAWGRRRVVVLVVVP